MARNPVWTRDELLLALEVYLRHGRKYLSPRHPGIVQLSQTLNALPIYPAAVRVENFRNPAGVAMKIGNLMRFDPQATTSLPGGGAGEEAVWDTYAHRYEALRVLTETIKSAAGQLGEPEVLLEDNGFEEGQIIERTHKTRERNRNLVSQKLKQVLAQTGRLSCEACDFDFEATYGGLGRGFAECHHRIPLSESGPGKTYTKDLAVLCSNCHQMIHRSKPMLSVEALRDLLNG